MECRLTVLGVGLVDVAHGWLVVGWIGVEELNLGWFYTWTSSHNSRTVSSACSPSRFWLEVMEKWQNSATAPNDLLASTDCARALQQSFVIERMNTFFPFFPFCYPTPFTLSLSLTQVFQTVHLPYSPSPTMADSNWPTLASMMEKAPVPATSEEKQQQHAWYNGRGPMGEKLNV